MHGSNINSVLLVDDDVAFLDCTRIALQSNGIENVTTLSRSAELLQVLASGKYSVLIMDWVMPVPSGADLLPEVRKQYPDIPVIILTGVQDLENVVSCMKQGAYDYVFKPVDTPRLISVVQRALNTSELSVTNRRLAKYLQGGNLTNPENFSDIVTSSKGMLDVCKLIEAIAPSSHPVLITGETGVGKELIARAIHKCSGLKGEMVTVNVSGFDDNMFGDALFGHKKGAFTGANESRSGFVEQAKGGTLFLDEIGDLSHASQVKLLRLLEQNEYHRLGSDFVQKSSARIITASNVNFDELIAEKKFRSDLFYRISTHTVNVPPLRERREDIVPIAEYYARKSAELLKRSPQKLSEGLKIALTAYDFQGNVRELANKVHDAVTHSSGAILTHDDFPWLPYVEVNDGNSVRMMKDKRFILHAIYDHFPTIEEVQTMLSREAYSLAGSNASVAAKMLGISRQTLQRRLDEAGEGGIKQAQEDEP